MFTGIALVEILRDQTMIKSFITLSYISDLMIGSQIMPIQKQQLVKIVKEFIGDDQFAAAVIASPQD